MLPYHYEYSAVVHAPMEQVFLHIDDPMRFSSHMSQSSWKMGGSRLTIEVDAGLGQKVGSQIRLSGTLFGIELALDEVVTDRTPPLRKVWKTTGAPKLLVIGHYRMGFELSPAGGGSRLRVFIDYALPANAPARWLGRLFGKYYARWCTHQMVDDTVRHFASG